MPLFSLLDGANSLRWDASQKKKKLLKAVSASVSQFLHLKAGLRVVLCHNILGLQIGILLGAQSVGN